MRCDGAHDIERDCLGEDEQQLLDSLLEEGIIRRARFGEYLAPDQEYKTYPAQYKREAHWSITGACNLRCRHCFMSAPSAKHGVPSKEQIVSIADQLAECGVFQVGITGGEPLTRKDFLDIVDMLNEREIGIDCIYTNGWLVDEELLDGLEKRGAHPPFQLSFDGVGCHDFLRGVPGAEEHALSAIRLLCRREHQVSVSMCLHRGNRHTLRETVKCMASLGVSSMKVSAAFELGEWAHPELADLRLSPEEELQLYLDYIPQYFDDDAPLAITLSGAFRYSPGRDAWDSFSIKGCPAEAEKCTPSCGVLVDCFYIGAEGMVCPCMGMADTAYAPSFPNLFETPLKDILGDSEFDHLCRASVSDVRDGSGKCRDCEFIDRCNGGCRNSALMAGEGYYGADPEACWFFEHDGDKRIAQVAKESFEAYLRRNQPQGGQAATEDDLKDCI
ncbi:MAG: radical SAM protein [Coriobacteriales bacterium]|nr:radical SAM protein [Coriobacteriales bacterium]